MNPEEKKKTKRLVTRLFIVRNFSRIFYRVKISSTSIDKENILMQK
jgi:hypothetical protein